jgi:hypothetical protein
MVFYLLEKATQPGEVYHLPLRGLKSLKRQNWQPPEMSPIVKLQLEDIKRARQRETKKDE